MVKKILNFKVLFVLLLFVGVMSCDKNNEVYDSPYLEEISADAIDLRDVTEDIADLDNSGISNPCPEQFAGMQRCFIPVYPLTIVFPDGSTQEVSDRDEMRSVFQTWRQNNPGVTDRPTIQFPFDATLRDGTVVTFNSQEDIRDVLVNCAGNNNNRGHMFDRCFTLVFPVTIIFPDGSTLEVEDQVDLRTAMMEWKQDNPGSVEFPEFQFPLDVTLSDGTVVTVNSRDELREIAQDCRPNRGHRAHFGDCFEVVFPVTIEFYDGTTQEVESKEALQEIMMDWMQNSYDPDERPHIQFPFDVELPNGDIVTVNDKQDLSDIMRECWRNGNGRGKGGHGNNGGSCDNGGNGGNGGHGGNGGNGNNG